MDAAADAGGRPVIAALLGLAWLCVVLDAGRPSRRGSRRSQPAHRPPPARGGGRRQRRSSAAVAATLPDVIDLFALAVGAGRNVTLALRAVSERSPPPWQGALRAAAAQVAAGDRVGDALAGLPGRLGEPARPLATALAASARYGTPLLAVLERLAADARAERRRRAEEAARRLPVTLLFPLVLCILPAFALLTLTPALAGALRSLRL